MLIFAAMVQPLNSPISARLICAHLQQGSGARLNESDLSVLAGGGEEAAVGAERHGEDHVCVVADCPHRVLYHWFQTVQVPDHHLCVRLHTHLAPKHLGIHFHH